MCRKCKFSLDIFPQPDKLYSTVYAPLPCFARGRGAHRGLFPPGVLFLFFLLEKEIVEWIFRHYKSKLTTAAEAVKLVKSGDWVDYTWCTNHPIELDKALAARQNELEDVKVRGGVTMWMPEIAKADDAGDHFAWHSWHCSGIDRKIMSKGMGWFSPMRYSELPRFYRENLDPVDVVMMQVPPMDEHGNFSLSLAPSHLYDMCARAKHIIVEINENLPAVYGLN